MASGMGLRRAAKVAAASLLAISVASCAAPQKTSTKKTRSKEYFAESAYGVKASPRVSNLRSKLPRGGGRDQTGKPYKVKGRWYYPKEESGYSKTGEASWYGDAFHGRLTANGEIYDMTHLTAAHPTMPLPSYARVTNRKNGSSVIVRVNDRGPFEKGRVIDLSRKAAEMLDYAHTGMADVKVDYLGRAPLHGKDDSFLMASYRPGTGAADPSDGLPTGVMIAMNGASPSRTASASVYGYPNGGVQALGALASGSTALPDFGPMAPDRPGIQQASASGSLALSYAQERVTSAASAFVAFDKAQQSALADRWRAARGGGGEYVAVGTFATRAEALSYVNALSSFGKVELDASAKDYAVTLQTDGRADIDRLLEASWNTGASDAFVVRN